MQIGDLVLIAEDNVLCNRWPMGRVMEVFCGEDSLRSTKKYGLSKSKQQAACSTTGGSFLNRHVC